MKAGFWCVIGVLMMGCASQRKASPPATETSKKSVAKVYFQGEGADSDIGRFRQFLEIALKDHGLVSTGSSRDADFTIHMRFRHEQRTQYQYAPVVWITLASPDRQEYVAKSCRSISTSDSIFKEPINTLSTVKLPADWKKHGSVFVIYINDSEMTSYLLSLVKRSLVEDGYRITGTRGGADVVLQSIRVQKLPIPMRVDAYYVDEEVFDRNSNRIMWSSKGFGQNTGFITYLGPEQGIKPESLPCKLMIGQVGQDGDQQSAGYIAGEIRKRFDGKANSN